MTDGFVNIGQKNMLVFRGIEDTILQDKLAKPACVVEQELQIGTDANGLSCEPDIDGPTVCEKGPLPSATKGFLLDHASDTDRDPRALVQVELANKMDSFLCGLFGTYGFDGATINHNLHHFERIKTTCRGFDTHFHVLTQVECGARRLSFNLEPEHRAIRSKNLASPNPVKPGLCSKRPVDLHVRALLTKTWIPGR